MEKIYSAEEIAAQRIKDKAELEELWSNLAEEAGGGERGKAIADAFKKLYTLYTPGLADWFSKLYDPEAGGYYATTSGHDTEGYGPDVEATIQSLRFIESSGMLRHVGDLTEALPEGMAERIVRFVKSLQNENGYFYHPQWSFNDVHYNLSRRGRDLGFAIGILEWFGASPTYDAPNGKAGDGIGADGKPIAYCSASCKTEDDSIIGGADTAKSADSPVAPNKKAPPYPEYLENRETFERYLDTIEIRTRSYWWGNQLNATYGQIKARAEALAAEGADYNFCDMLINWLNERIDPNTGYWGEAVNMAGSNGFFKIITIYNMWGYPYPMPERVTESILTNIMGDELPSGNCCSVYNLWCAIGSIKRNVRKTCSKALCDKVISRIDEILRDRGAEAILNTYKKMAPFRKGEVFSGQYEGCGGSQQSLYVGLNHNYGVLEGNVDATCICSTGLTRTMFTAFELERVPMLGLADWMVYKNNLLTYGPAKKTRTLNPEISFSDEFVPNVVAPFGDGTAEIKDGKLSGTLCPGGGFRLMQTARICKGDYRLFEADISFSSLKGDKTVLVTAFTGGSELRGSGFFTLKFGDGKLTCENKKWDVGFSSVHKLADNKVRLRIELYLNERRQRANPQRLSSAGRIYINGVYAGEYVNDDGTEYAYPSGINLNNETLILITGFGNTTATAELSGYRFSYHTEEK